MRLRIFNYDYYNILDNEYDKDLECPIMVITGREQDGKFHCIKIPGNKEIFKPHFFVEDTPYNEIILKKLKLEYEKWPHPAVYDENERVLIAYTQYPFEVPKVRNMFEHTYEADVPYEKMFMMKLRLNGGYLECPDKEWLEPEEIKAIPEEQHFIVEPRVCYFDIETRVIDETIEQFDLRNNEIISIVVYDNYLNRYDSLEWSKNNSVYWTQHRITPRILKHEDIPETSSQIIHHCISEKQLLIKFYEIFLRRFDAIFAFNSHGGNVLNSYKSQSVREWQNGFDEPVIHIRSLYCGLEREMQTMSPIPTFKNIHNHYYGVYKRGVGDKYEVVVRGMTPLDFYYAEPLMQYTAKDRDFFGRGLDDYMKYYAKHGKVEHEGLSVAELKDLDLEKELHYNKVDVEGCLFLDKRFGFSNDIFDTVSLSKVKGIDILKATKIHDFIILDESQDTCVYDTKYQAWSRGLWKGWLHEKADEYGIIMKKDKPGGYNVPMKRGIGGWTAVFDFSGLYPTLASAANAGIDTLIHVKEELEDHYIDTKGKKWMKKDVIITPAAPFRKDIISIEKHIWDKLLAFRKRYKDKFEEVQEQVNYDTKNPLYKLWWSKQYNLKTRLINNKYGASGNSGFRNYCYPVYAVPPTLGQLCIQGLEKELIPELGLYCRGGDTDSIFVALESTNIDDAMKECDKIAEACNAYIDRLLDEKFNIQEHNVKIGWEKIGPKFYGHMKKNYLLEVWAQDGKKLPEKKRYIMYKGFEMKKSNRADITEIVQRVYFKKVQESNNNEEFLPKIYEVIKRIEDIFEYIPLRKICSRIKIKRNLMKYAVNFAPRRAAEYANERYNTNYTLGSQGFIAWLEGNNKPKPVAMFKKKDIKKMNLPVDYKHHKQKFVIDKLDYLLDDFKTGYHKLRRANRITSPNVL